jgi:hypothetical protein
MATTKTAAGTKLTCLQVVRNNLLVILTFVGAAVGFAVGFGVRATDPSRDALMWLGESALFLFFFLSVFVA